MSDKIREMLSALRVEADNAITRAELAEEKNKEYEQLILKQDQNTTRLEDQVSLLSVENENLMRKMRLMEEEADVADEIIRFTQEKLRLLDIKARRLERQAMTFKLERDEWESAYEAISVLRTEADDAVARAELAEEQNKRYEQLIARTKS
ncbi:hypothetical protein EYR40_000005 [Pleurotus pulmonarius]|nr:hypothetical protein EYR40_000005 [Pleurotus pulmonarius]